MLGGLGARLKAAGKAFALSDGIEAGRMARRMAGWVPSRSHVNTLIQASGPTTLARARYLVRNNPYAMNALECFCSGTVGAGIVPRYLPPEGSGPDLKKQWTALWTDWTDEADAEGLTDLYGLMRRAAREVFMAGECFIRRRPRRISDGLTVPLQLQMLPSEMLDLAFTQDMENGNRVRQGIEFDRIGRRVAYHFWVVHPGDNTERMVTTQRVRVPASEVLHILDPLEGGQVRGLSRMSAAIVSMWVLDAYDDAELERKKTAALFALYVTRPDPDGEMFAEAERKAKEGGSEVAEPKLEPGTAQVLMPGETIETSAPADVGANYETFEYRALLRISAACGVPYAGMTGDPTRANFASQRSIAADNRRRVEAFQHGVLVFQMCRPVANWFTEAAFMADRISLPGYAENRAQYQKARWIPPRWEWPDPLKDRQAEVVSINARAKSISHWIEQEGYDPDEVFALIAEEQEKMRKLGILPAAPQPDTRAQDDAAAEEANERRGPPTNGAAVNGYAAH